ncbi:hypothetical protein [Burkholderia glumae]|uniref:hypothetical protein n=1 Tax=Burkholderia glumae TaxID=337 RepID=UPI0021511CA4|nr:hypothetical protein [Burkholderia glumae]
MFFGLLDIAGVGLVYAFCAAILAAFACLAYLVLRTAFRIIRAVLFESTWPVGKEDKETVEAVEALRAELKADPDVLRRRFDDLHSRKGTDWEVYRQMEVIRAFRRLHRAEWRHYNKLNLL